MYFFCLSVLHICKFGWITYLLVKSHLVMLFSYFEVLGRHSPADRHRPVRVCCRAKYNLMTFIFSFLSFLLCSLNFASTTLLAVFTSVVPSTHTPPLVSYVNFCISLYWNVYVQNYLWVCLKHRMVSEIRTCVRSSASVNTSYFLSKLCASEEICCLRASTSSYHGNSIFLHGHHELFCHYARWSDSSYVTRTYERRHFDSGSRFLLFLLLVLFRSLGFVFVLK